MQEARRGAAGSTMSSLRKLTQEIGALAPSTWTACTLMCRLGAAEDGNGCSLYLPPAHGRSCCPAAALLCCPAEKTLKKVQEGLEIFDDHQEQYDTTDPSNANAREKLESQVGWLVGGLVGCRDRTASRSRVWLVLHPLLHLRLGASAAFPHTAAGCLLLPPLPQLKDQIKKLQRLRDSIKTWCVACGQAGRV